MVPFTSTLLRVELPVTARAVADNADVLTVSDLTVTAVSVPLFATILPLLLRYTAPPL